jgi:hypothetical protein
MDVENEWMWKQVESVFIATMANGEAISRTG